MYSALVYRYSSVLFHFVGSIEKVSRVNGKTRFIMSSYTYLALGFSNPVGTNFPSGASELIPLAPTATYVGVILNVTIVTLERNYSACTSELFPFGAKLVLHTDSTLRRNFSAGVSVRTFVEDRTLRRSCPLAQNSLLAGLWYRIYVEAVRYVEMVPLARNSPVGTSFR